MASSAASQTAPAKLAPHSGKEARLRAGGAALIQRAGILLRVPQVAVISAATIFQHFYCRANFGDVEAPAGAAGSLLLACKLEEHHRRLRDVVAVFHRLQMRELKNHDGTPMYAKHPTPVLDHSKQEYADLKLEILRAERHILKELGFAVALLLEHPHKFVLPFVNSLFGKDLRQDIAQKAWAYLNDAMRTNLCCTHKPHQLAVASIYLAARQMGIKMPQNPPWWSPLDTEASDLRLISRAILSLYRSGSAKHFRHPLVRHLSAALPPMRSPSADEMVALAVETDGLTASDLPQSCRGVKRSQSDLVVLIGDSPPEPKRRCMSEGDGHSGT
mmetsp:Transcript_19039/g.34427  ORF Transcript_19039/g.34427 Transcript_19039/m.34427 type:complete len:331 (+) Transcript_19039:83-1075(+)